MTKQEHKNLGIKYFNGTWDLIDKENRSKDEDLIMIQMAHQSLHHWRNGGGTPLNLARGEWLISHMYAVLGMGEPALNHAITYQIQVSEHGFGDFDLVFVYEALAYAYKLLDMNELREEALNSGYKLLDQVEKQGDKDYCRSQLDLLK